MKQILIVDDDLDILDAIDFVLEDAGFSVETNLQGEFVEQLTKAKQFPKLIILDVLLSGKDGRDICRLLKMCKRTKAIPIIMISAHPAVKQSVKAAGADAFIPKPFDITMLLQTVNKLLIPS